MDSYTIGIHPIPAEYGMRTRLPLAVSEVIILAEQRKTPMATPINMSNLDEVIPGDRIVIRSQPTDGSPPSDAVVTLAGSGNRITGAAGTVGTLTLVDPAGDIPSRYFTASDGRRWRPFYTLPLPERLSEADLVAYARAMRPSPAGADPASGAAHATALSAFYVEAREHGRITARMVSTTPGYMVTDGEGRREAVYRVLGTDEIDNGVRREGDGWYSCGPIRFSDRGFPAGIRAGNVFVGTGLSAARLGGTTVAAIANAAVLPGEFPDVAAAAAAFPAREGRKRTEWARNHAQLEPAAQWLLVRNLAMKSGEIDEALVVAVPRTHTSHGTDIVRIVARRGVTFYLDDGLAEWAMAEEGLAPGVHHVTSPRARNGTFDYDDRPADLATLRSFGLELEDVGRIARSMDRDSVLAGLDEVAAADFLLALGTPGARSAIKDLGS